MWASKRASLSIVLITKYCAFSSKVSRFEVPILPYFKSSNSSNDLTSFKFFFFILFLFCCEVFLFQTISQFKFLFWCFLCLFLESIKQNDQIAFVETAENPINIAAVLNPDFIQSICSFQVIQKFSWNPVYRPKQGKYIIYFLLNIFWQSGIKVDKVMLMKNDLSLFFHLAKLTIKLTIGKLFYCEKRLRQMLCEGDSNRNTLKSNWL